MIFLQINFAIFLTTIYLLWMGDWKNRLLCVNYIELPSYLIFFAGRTIQIAKQFCKKNRFIHMIYLRPTTFFLTCSRYLFGRKFAKIWFGLELITCFFGIPYLKHLKEICNVADEIFSTVYKYGSRHGCALYISRCT